jgi:protein deglycase
LPPEQLCQQVTARQTLVGAICAAPIVLQAAGLLKGKNVTCYPAFSNQVQDARYTGAAVEVDGRLITGAGPGAAIEFSLALVTALGDPAKAAALRQGMIVRP